MGGLARRASYIERFRERLARIPTLLADSGYFVADERNAHGELRPDIAAKNEWVAKSDDQFTIDVANLSSRDLKYFSPLLAKREFEIRSASQPFLRKLVSANTLAASAAVVPPQPFIVREVPARQGNGVLRVAFIGLTETQPPPPRGFKFIDPVEAARQAVPEARKRADIVIALAYLKSEDAARVAREAPGIDAIIVTDSQSNGAMFTPPAVAGKTLILFTPFETRMLGELRFYRDTQGSFSTVSRFITLDDSVPDHPAAKQLTVSAAEAEANARDTSKRLLESWLAASRMRRSAKSIASEASSGPEPAHTGAAACSRCHGDQYLRWSVSSHARATDRLPARQAEFELSCLKCHATGWREPKAGSTELPGLQNVQCEQCHGPGAEHALNPAKGYGRISDVTAACSVCHTPDTSRGFDPQAAWAKIKH
ncbi:MAG: multiheme c-type cytochrome [Acidobacteriota bacterium]